MAGASRPLGRAAERAERVICMAIRGRALECAVVSLQRRVEEERAPPQQERVFSLLLDYEE
jgi:hypothetical protein